MKSMLLVARSPRAEGRDLLRLAGAALALTLAVSTLPLRAFADPVVSANPVPGIVNTKTHSCSSCLRVSRRVV